jgi:hypothetical protein
MWLSPVPPTMQRAGSSGWSADGRCHGDAPCVHGVVIESLATVRPFDDKMVIRGGYGIFHEVESSGNRVNHNMVPYALSETVFNNLPTMANFFVGRPIGGATAAPSLAGGYPNICRWATINTGASACSASCRRTRCWE